MPLHLSVCCNAELEWPQNLDGISAPQCVKCKRLPQGFFHAQSNCCVAPIDVVPGGWPWTCSSCEGNCEFATPGTPTHYEDVQTLIKRVIYRVSIGTLTVDEAYKVISKTFDEEIELASRDTIDEIRAMIGAHLLPPILPIDPVTSGIVQGYDVAMQIFDKIIQDSLNGEGGKVE